MRQIDGFKQLSIQLFLTLVSLLMGLSITSSINAQTPTNSESVSTDSAIVATPIPEPPEGMNITLSPIFLTLQTDPNQPITREIKIRNNSDASEFLEINLAKFRPDETGAKPILMDLEPSDRFADWVTFSEQRFEVVPGEWKTITVTFTPPTEAALDYYYVFVFNRQNTQANDRDAVLSGAPAMLALATVNSPLAKRELQLQRFSLPKVFFEFLPVQFDLSIANTGNTYLAPTGSIFIDSGNQKDIAILAINPDKANILPESHRDFQVEWTEGFPKYVTEPINPNNENERQTKLVWDFSEADKFRIGKYTANLLMVYDNGERDVLIESQQSFWVIPWRLLIALILIPVIPALIVFIFMKLTQRRSKKR